MDDHYLLSAKSVRNFFVVSYAKNREPVAGNVRTNVGPRPLYSALGPGQERKNHKIYVNHANKFY